MNVLVLGSGGREHAIAWKIRQSPLLSNLYIAPGNAGTETVGENVALSPTDFDAIASFIKSKQIDLMVVGPEAPLVEGIVDYFEGKPDFSSLNIIGPSAAGALLEGSKEHAKAFMERQGIPTARYQSFTAATIEEAHRFLEELSAPYVLKADGLAAGKGVLILDDLAEAKEELNAMLLDAKFGAASASVVIEEFLSGIEMSVFVLTDGKNYQLLPEAKDYKRIGEGDSGLNTGGMGAVSPVPFADATLMKKIEERIVQPTIAGFQKEKVSYCGFVFIGLMIVDQEPFVIEYNVRMGDPETEVVMPRIKSDLLQHLSDCASGKLMDHPVILESKTATTVMLVSGGYPEAYQKGKEISGLDTVEEGLVFHAGTSLKEGKVLTSGGRVIALTAMGNTKEEALKASYRNAAKISFEGMYYRKDIGFDL
jgi:phosphoribosylamine--glycine ligase